MRMLPICIHIALHFEIFIYLFILTDHGIRSKNTNTSRDFRTSSSGSDEYLYNAQSQYWFISKNAWKRWLAYDQLMYLMP